MDFFSVQEQSRKKTKLLIFLFLLSVIALILITNLFIMLVAEYTTDYYVEGHQIDTFWRHFNWERFIGVGIGVSAVILAGSLIRTFSLRSGGKAIAESMRARLVSGNPRSPLERRLLNVVEEMAIASGTPVPQVYVLDLEDGINAFAAGYTPGDAVITVTRGCLEKLNRAELQGVIAHEFSHILNGDMRLNMRLVGVLFGILMVALVGRLLIRWGTYSLDSRKNNHNLPVILLGGGLFAIGYIGVFFGNLIKAAVSRQREYLADASAVQFTREPQGIAGALKKIGAEGSLLRGPDTEEMSHAYFSEGIHYFFAHRLFATHPPLEERIRRLDPHWDGDYIEAEKVDMARIQREEDQIERRRYATTAAVAGMAAVSSARITQKKRKPDPILPMDLKKVASEPYGARALIYALLLQEGEVLRRQLAHIEKYADPGVARLTKDYLYRVKLLDPHLRLVIIDLSMPALHQLSPEQYRLFKKNLQALIAADGRVSAFEWALEQIVIHHLAVQFEHRISRLGHYRLQDLKKEINIMLSYLAHQTRDKEIDALQAFKVGVDYLQMKELRLLPKAVTRVETLDEAMKKLNELKPLEKPILLKACAVLIASDQQLSALELELLRAFATLLDCPLPPLPDLPKA